jgi:outer membrane protein
MKTYFILFLLLLIPLSAQQVLTLEKSIQMGLENNKQLKISGAKVLESEAKASEVGSYLLPKVSLSASYTRLSDVPPFEVNIPIAPAPIKIQDALLNNYSLKASVQQPLFTGFRLSSAKKAADLNKKATSELYEAELNNTSLNISTAFWNAFRAEKMVELASKSIERTKILLRDTKNFLDNGLVTKADYLKIDVLFSNSKLAELEAKNGLKLAEAALNKEIGLDLTEDVKISASVPIVDFSEYNLDNLIAEGISQRAEIKSYTMRLDASDANITMANSGWYPNIALFGDYVYSNPNQRIMPLEDKFYDTWDVGVALNWNIWDWGETSAKAEQALQQKVQVENALQNIKDNIKLEIYSAYLNLHKEYDKVQLNKLTLEQAQASLEITRNQYIVQMASSNDLVDAETTFLKAETNLISAQIDFELAKIKLNKAVGRKLY